MSTLPESPKEIIDKVLDQGIEKAVPVLNIKVPELVADIPEIIKDENVKKCFPSLNFREWFTSLISGLRKKKNIVSSE